jgi:ligand-binding sensor domain-containing protein
MTSFPKGPAWLLLAALAAAATEEPTPRPPGGAGGGASPPNAAAPASATPPVVEPPAAFRQLSLEQGLSQAVVRALAQDDRGFLWIATEDGLNRYDGYGFTVFRNDPADPDSIPDNGPLSFAKGRGDVLWIGTVDRGLTRLDLSTLRFRRFLPDPSRADALPSSPVAAVLEDS